MEWTGIRFYKVEAESISDGDFRNLAVNLDITDMKMERGDLRIDFTYTADYQPKIATLRFLGYIMLAGEKNQLSKIQRDWKKNKTIPKDIADPLVNVVTFNAETNSVLVSRAINIVPPILSPKFEIPEEKA